MSKIQSCLEKVNLYKNQEASPSQAVEKYLSNIEQQKNLNAYNFVFNELALDSAKKVEEKIANGTAGKLAGLVVAIKDVLSIKDLPMTSSSKILTDFTPLYTAFAVQKLINEDAIIIGKTNCDEFAMGSSNENSAFGNVLNPVDITRTPGGSSGGSAVAVAANLCDFSLGTDTGGSIRQPAAFCGVVGLKPTYSLVSRFGLTAFASSFDSIGPFTHCVEDAALALGAIAGYDKNDSTSSNTATIDYNSEIAQDVKKIRIGIPKEYFADGLQQEIKESIEAIIKKLEAQGFEIEPVSLPLTEYAIATYYILTTAEASSNLARFDGVRFGYRSQNSPTLDEMYKNSRSEGFGAEVKRRIMLGTYVLSAGYYDAYYKKAQQVRRLLKEDFEKAFAKVDVLITPVTPTTAFKLGEKTADPLEMYLADIFTISANLAGIPGLNIPIGKDAQGLPIGMQLMAGQFCESKLFSLGKHIEQTILQ